MTRMRRPVREFGTGGTPGLFEIGTAMQNTGFDLSSRHIKTTRLIHAGLAVAIVIQLTTSLVMRAPEHGRVGNGYFDIHQYGGLAAFAFVFAFWAVVAFRKRGTPVRLLFPWASADRRADLYRDVRRHASSLRALRLPVHDGPAPFSAAVHGLGLLLMTTMAVSGTIYYFINTGDTHAGGLVGLVLLVHEALASLVWVYLIGHAGLAVLQHFTKGLSLAEMWSFRNS